jgi:hypothetical protein
MYMTEKEGRNARVLISWITQAKYVTLVNRSRFESTLYSRGRCKLPCARFDMWFGVALGKVSPRRSPDAA